MEQLLRFIVEESPEDADSKRAFKYVHCGLLEITSLAFADEEILSRCTVDLV